MAAATRDPAQQRQLIEQQKALLEDRFDQGRSDARELLDWKARLRRDGPRIAAVGGAVVVLVAGSLVLRAVVRSRRRQSPAEPPRDDLGTLVAELKELREELGKQRKGGSKGGLGGKVALAAVSAAASAAGKQAANRIVERQEHAAAA